MVLSSASIGDKNSYSSPLYPLVKMSILFGPGERLDSTTHSRLGGVIFVFLLGGMTFFAVIGVFVRRTIDTWIQFSLYIVPLIALTSGFRVYTSPAFNKLLKRKLSKKSLVQGFDEGSDQDEISWHESQRKQWLRKTAIQNCLYPLSLEIYQWTAYVIFHHVFDSDKFAGSWKESNAVLLSIDNTTWLIMYCFFWVLAMYVTGFVAYSFILVSRMTVRDVISFMFKFGDSPFLFYRPTAPSSEVLKPLNPVKKFIQCISGFLFMDLFQTGRDIELITENDKQTGGDIYISDSGFTEEDCEPQWDTEAGTNDLSTTYNTVRQEIRELCVPHKGRVSPVRASQHLSNIVASIDALSSFFQPFIVLIVFFSIANIVTHVGAFLDVVKTFESSHWWTLMRTCIWFLLSIRLLWSTVTITRALSLVSQHVKYLWSVGQLQGSKDEWEKFFKLLETFQLGSRTYGFPFTLKQAASIATFLNFGLIIGLSILKPSVHGNENVD